MLSLSNPTPMQTLTHSLAHRTGPGITRPKARWQPYGSHSPAPTRSSSSSSSSQLYLHTPASSVTSSPPSSASSSSIHAFNICTTEPPPSALPISRHGGSLRELQKTRYVSALVDQAVKSLDQIWQPQDIPPAFSGRCPSRPVAASASEPAIGAASCFSGRLSALLQHRNVQLPSPLTPSMQTSPFCTPSTSPVASLAQPQIRVSAPAGTCSRMPPPTSVVSIRAFVHEVLRRSKTSASVLQTALCYIEAVRSKIPELVNQERLGLGSQPEVPIEERIVQEDVFEAANATQATPTGQPTVRVLDDLALVPPSPLSSDEPLAGEPTTETYLRKSKVSATAANALPSLPPLPSPLLCPRRTFLAAIILASKFMQDKSYSNKAWAKLSGLPPREIGRCERALGAALEWRLWVGKLPQPPAQHAVVRSQSVGELLLGCTAPPTSAAAAAPTPCTVPCTAPFNAAHARVAARANAHRLRSGLARSSTLPAEIFAASEAAPNAAAPMAVSPLAWATPTPSAAGCSPAASMVWGTPMACSPAGSVPMLDGAFAAYSPCSVLAGATPSLTYSPASTVSSAGELTRTIQMAAFCDVDVGVASSSPAAPYRPGMSFGFGGSWNAINHLSVNVSCAVPSSCALTGATLGDGLNTAEGLCLPVPTVDGSLYEYWTA